MNGDAPWDGAGAPGGASPRPEPGAGSAGRGAAGAALIYIWLNSAVRALCGALCSGLDTASIRLTGLSG